MITIKTNGKKYSGFQEISVMRSIESLCGTFDLQGTAEVGNDFPIKIGEKIEIFVNDNLVLTGDIEQKETIDNPNTHTISASGRDVTNFLIDGTPNITDTFSENTNLKTIIQEQLKGTTVKLINSAGNISAVTSSYTGDENLSGWKLIETLCRQKKIIPTTTADGNLELVKIQGDVLPVFLKKIKNAIDNNILSSNFIESNAERFYKYIIKSQDFGDGQTVGVFDKEINKNRTTIILANESQEIGDLEAYGKWLAMWKKARSFQYVCKVQGFEYAEGKIWKPNCLVKVTDEISGVDEVLFLYKTEFSLTLDGGSVTTLHFRKKEAISDVYN